MERIKLAEGVDISRVVVGCMRACNAGLEAADLRSLVHQSMEMGVDTFDHAPVYAAGECERFFGEAVLAAEPGIRDQLKIVTKTGIIPGGRRGNRHPFYINTREQMLREIDESLMRLHTDHVDVLLIHRPDLLGDPREMGETLDAIVASGKALTVGVSNFEPTRFDALQQYTKNKLVLNQVEFSPMAVDNYFNGTIDCAFRHQSGLMAWSPLAGGRIFSEQSQQAQRVREEINYVAKEQSETLGREVSFDTVIYSWLMKHPVGILPVTGSMKADRIRAAVEACDVELSYDQWYGIMAASRGFEVP